MTANTNPLDSSLAYAVLQDLELTQDEAIGLLAGMMDSQESVNPGYIANLTLSIVEVRQFMDAEDE